ncbi:hypothetical protein NKG05_26175 [Oerskovia sp. M15]
MRWIGLTRRRPRTLLAAMGYEHGRRDRLRARPGTRRHPRERLVASGRHARRRVRVRSVRPGLRAAPDRDPGAASPVATPSTPRDAHGSFVGLLRRVQVPALGMLAMGMLFGSTQTAVTSFMRDTGAEEQAGLVYAVLGFGSAITALAVVALPTRWVHAPAGSPSRRGSP